MSSSQNTTVPACSTHMSAGQYSASAQEGYDPTSWEYYKGYVLSPQVLPGLIIGALCWIGAIILVVYLLTLCCRSVGWRSRRSKTHDVSEKSRNKWAMFNVGMTIVTLAVIGSCTWALVDGIKATNGQVNEVWNLIEDVRVKLIGLDATVQTTSTSLSNLGSSVNSTYSLVNSNQAAATAAGVNVPQTLATLSGLSSQIQAGQTGTTEAQANIGNTGISKVESLQDNYQKKTQDAWKTYRIIAVAVFFGLLIFFGVIVGFLAVLDRTPRLAITFTLFLLIWTGLVLLFGTGALNVVWRVTRDTCLYGISFAAVKLGGGGNTGTLLNYYFQKTYIAPQDVSQTLFKFNLTSTIQTINSTEVSNLVSQIQSTNGQLLVATASAQDQANINALSPRISYLSGNLTTLNTEIQASQFADITNGVQGLICCSVTNALWRLWLASTITGALALLLVILAVIKTITAIRPLGENAHYTPHNPNGFPKGTKGYPSGTNGIAQGTPV